jgi:DNA modification methylase
MKGAGVGDYLAPGAVHIGSVLDLAGRLEPQSVQTIVTSPPYFGLRAYLPADHPDKAHELGSEATPEQFVANLVAVFRALWPALKDDGTLWLNLGDSYWTKPIGKGSTHDPKWGQARNRSEGNAGGRTATAGQHKNLIGIPWRVAFALQADGWILRSDIVWHKPAPMPESVTDRPTRAHEFIFLLTKSTRYFYDAAAIAEPCVAGDRGSTYTDGKTGDVHATRGQGRRTDKQAASGLRTYSGFNDRWDASPTTTRNKRDVWTVASAQFPDAHYATFPAELIYPCVLAGSRPGDLVLDPCIGSGTVAQVAHELGREWQGIDLDERAVTWTNDRLAKLPVGRLFA